MSSTCFTPRVLLVLFCSCNMLSYLERGSIASNGVTGSYKDEDCVKTYCTGKDGNPGDETHACRVKCGYTGIQGDFNLTNAEAGLMASLYTVGLTVACPISAHAVRVVHPFTIIGVGQLVFSLALLGCGLSTSFGMLLSFRALLGVAEPAFIVVAPPLIERFAPDSSKTLWLASFYVCISLGSAGGFIYGSFFSGGRWQLSFLVQAMMNLPLALLFLTSRPSQYTWDRVDDENEEAKGVLDKDTRHSVSLKTLGESTDNPLAARGDVKEEDATTDEKTLGMMPLTGDAPITTRGSLVLSSSAVKQRSVCRDISDLLKILPYVLVLVAYTSMTAVSGAIVFWGPKAGSAIFKIDNADISFGIMVVVAGTAGTLAGGGVLDKLGGGFANAARVCCYGMLVGGVLCTAGFWVPPKDPNIYAFFVLFSIGYFCIATLYGPVCAATLWSVPPDLRAQAMGLSTFVIHCFGDVPSPYYTGALNDYFQNWQLSLTLVTPLLGVASFFFFLASLTGEPKLDEGEEPQIAP